ncbi:MAG: type II/IV secretion system protein [Ignavibacteriae bacterium]|nr:type II/IV secretion system protein [Ignavibacteriota bacterium]
MISLAYGDKKRTSISDKKVNNNVLSECSNIEYVNNIISDAIKCEASDIHFEVYKTGARIRFRIDGFLQEISVLPISKFTPILSRLKIMANLDIAEKRRPQDGRINFEYLGEQIDIRISSLPTSAGEKIVLRILDTSKVQLDINKIGLNDSQLKIFRKNISLPYGMVLVTGPTGSGKTTTLYSALREIHSVEKNILTIEDPIEFNIEGINQSAVKHDIGYDFASALKSFLRQDPNVIMVGEIRDRETAEIAIRASLTGHLVFSTLHTNDSLSAITRLVDMGVDPYLVSSSLRMIVAQRLVRKICTCNKKHIRNNSNEESGCTICNNTGFRGRTAIFEILEVNEDLACLISRNESNSSLRDAVRKNDFISLRDSGMEKVEAGHTTIEEVLRETML